jgi:3-phytase
MNKAPVASPDSLTAAEDGAGAAAVLVNDADPNLDGLVVTESTDGRHGSVECTPAGLCTYVPAPDYNGSDSFTYTVSDRRGGTATATVTATVTPVNDPPVARSDRAFVAEGGVVVLDPLGNDAPGPPDESAQALTLDSVVAHPSYGDAAVASGEDAGKLRYTAADAYTGPDWVGYQVCDDGEPEPQCADVTVTLSVKRVVATAETEPVPNAGDAADDAAVWIDPTDPGRSAIIGTDKGGVGGVGGIAVYDLAGDLIEYRADGRMNNVDLRDGFPLAGQSVSLVTAGNRTDNTIAVYRFEPATRTLVDVAARAISPGVRAYGSCMYRSPTTGSFFVVVTSKTGDVEQWELFESPSSAGLVDARLVRSFAVGSQTEGCVADDDLGRLYLAEGDVGIWRYAAEPDGDTSRVSVDMVGPGGHLAADVEGLALAREADGAGYLVAASQGDRSFAVYRRQDDNDFVRTVRIKDGEAIDAPSGMDGIDAVTESLGPAFPHGLLVVHDGTNEDAGAPANQNYKLVPLELVLGDGSEADAPARPSSCPRPYAGSSPWNTPIGATPAYDPDSDLHVSALAGRLSSDPTQYTYPVYYVTSTTPLQAVRFTGWYSNVTNGGQTLTNERAGENIDSVLLPLPPEAEPAAGSDAQIVLVDPVTGDEWGASHLERDADGNLSAWNVYHYNTAWSGVPPYDASGDPFFARGAGVPYLTGLVRPCEIARGRIEHALAFAYDFPTDESIYPATKSDGNAWDGVEDELDSHPGDMPEGTRLQLDPALTPADLQALGCTGPCLTIARALQEYGMYVIDNSRRPKVMLEYEGTARWNGLIDSTTVEPIPLSAFKVLEPQAPSGG